MRAYLSGTPECKFGLNDKLALDKAERAADTAVKLDDCQFHQCVELGVFSSDRTISFIPPDGEFELMKCVPFFASPLASLLAYAKLTNSFSVGTVQRRTSTFPSESTPLSTRSAPRKCSTVSPSMPNSPRPTSSCVSRHRQMPPPQCAGGVRQGQIRPENFITWKCVILFPLPAYIIILFCFPLSCGWD